MKIAILGLGAYGIALAKTLVKKNEITMWSAFADEVAKVNSSRENSAAMKGIKLENEIRITSDLKEAIETARIIVIAVPMFAVREVCKSLNGIIEKQQIICVVSKGVEKETYLFPSQVVHEELPKAEVAMVSGPSFAIELASGAETGLTIASENEDNIYVIKEAFESSNLDFDTTCDLRGVQICRNYKKHLCHTFWNFNGKSEE